MIKVGIECESIEDSETWGIARQISELLKELSRRPELASQFKFFLYFKGRVPDYPYLASRLFEKKVLALPLVPVSFSLYYYLYLPVRLWFDRPAVTYFPNYMLSLLFTGRSLSTLTEDFYYEMTGRTLSFRYRLAYNIFGRWAARHGTRIMALSESSKPALIKLFGIASSRIAVNPLGINPEARNMKRKTEKCFKLNAPSYILYVGQAFPRRHLRETILAFKQILPDFTGLKLVVIGKDKYNPPVIANMLDENIIQRDYVSNEELAALYQRAKLCVYVSSHEAFGLPPLEALGQGTPAVVAETPVNRELYGDNAFFVPAPYTPASIAGTLRRGLTDAAKRQAILAAAPAIVSRYTWSAHTDRWLEIIRKVATL